MEFAYQLTKNLYSNKPMLTKRKMQRGKTLIVPECLVTTECLVINSKGEDDELIRRK